MTTVTMNPTNAAALPIGSASTEPAVQINDGTATITDSRGRRIAVKRPNLLQKMRLAGLLGAEDSANRMVFMNYYFASCVISIDGEPESFPTSRRQADALIQQLDDDGVIAAAEALSVLEKGSEVDKAAAGN